MRDKEWKRVLRREASAHHMCEDYRHALDESDSKVSAIGLYKRMIDWALEEGYPSLEVLREHFSDYKTAGIYIDEHFDGEVLDAQQVYVFHHCTGTIRTGLNLDKMIIPMLYFANGCDMKIESSNEWAFSAPVRVPLYLFGPNRVEAADTSKLKCVTYKHTVK